MQWKSKPGSTQLQTHFIPKFNPSSTASQVQFGITAGAVQIIAISYQIEEERIFWHLQEPDCPSFH